MNGHAHALRGSVVNVGTKKRTLEKFERVKKLMREGLNLTIALKRAGLSTSTFYKLKAKYEPSKNEAP